jgi:hypothetical protein
MAAADGTERSVVVPGNHECAAVEAFLFNPVFWIAPEGASFWFVRQHLKE